MGRLLVLALIVVLIVWVLRRAISGPRGRGGADGGRAAADGAARGDLVSCAHCGVNLPRAEASVAGGRLYCGEEHGRLGPRDR